MKKFFSFVAIAVAVVVPQAVSADTITSLTADIGSGSTATFTTGVTSGGADFSAPQLVIQEFTAGGIVYDSFVGTDGFIGGDGSAGDVEAIVFAPGGTAPTGAVFNAPGPALGVFGDLDLSTGSLDTFQVFGSSPANEYFDFASQTITGGTTFFLFNNGTNLSGVSLVDSNGISISNSLNFTAIGAESELSDFVLGRTNGGNLTNRDIHGNIFAVSEFTLNAGASVADIAGFTATGASSDFHDAGIAFAAVVVPEPSSAIVLLSGLGALFLRRRK